MGDAIGNSNRADNAMKTKNIVTASSIVVIIGFIDGFITSISHITANQYIRHKTFRLIAIAFQKNWNHSVLVVLGLLFALYVFWFLTVKKMKFDKGKVISFIITLAVLLPIQQLLQHFSGHTFWSATKELVAKIAASLAGTVSVNNILWLFKKHLISIIILTVVLIAMPLLFRLLAKLNWRKISGTIQTKYIRKAGLVFLALLLALNLGIIIDKKVNLPEGPNVILISVETLRPGHLGCYGYERNTSPNVDKFADENVLFENCFSQAPSTGPSCSSFLSGFLPHETKVLKNMMPLPLPVLTLAEMLKQAGYKTYGVVSNYVLRKNSRFYQGFDVYDDTMDQKELVRGLPERIAEHTTTCAINILKRHKAGGFFMWIHYQDPHGPYTPQKPYDSLFLEPGKKPVHLRFNDSVSGAGGIPSYQRLDNHNDYHYYVAQYDGEIRYFDEHFRRLVEALKELGFYDNSLIIFTADHGEAMGEHNCYFAHGLSLNNNQIHIPLIVRYGKLSPDRRKDYVQQLDIVPTILRIVGIPTNHTYRGRDLLVRHSEPAIICSELGLNQTSVIVDGLKLVMHDKQASLFEISNDPFQEHDLSQHVEHQKHLMRLTSQLQRLRQEDFIGLKHAAETPVLTDQERQKLRSLGYVD